MNSDTLIQELGGNPSPTLKQRFDSKWILDSDSGCWIWNGSKRGGDLLYGGLVIMNKHFLAHRISWILHRGELSSNMDVLHKCDVPLCVNPDHLFLGTQLDNVRDMINKGRRALLQGEKAGSSKLKEPQVLEILKLRKNGSGVTEIARLFDVTKQCICGITRGRQWKHIQRR